MSFFLYKNNRSPSLSDTIKVSGVAVDLTGATVRLRMRAQGASTLKVDTVATIVSAAAGTVRYDWAALDVDTVDDYVAWWSVTLAGGLVQDTPEFEIKILDHAAGSVDWIDLQEAKDQLEITGTNRDDALRAMISAASRALNRRCKREITPQQAALTRTFAIPYDYCYVERIRVPLEPYDLRTATTVTLNPEASSPTVLAAGIDYALWPVGGSTTTGTYTSLHLSRYVSSLVASVFADRFGAAQIRVLGDWGAYNTATVPEDLKRACIVTVGSWIDKAISEYGKEWTDQPRFMQASMYEGFAIPRGALSLLTAFGIGQQFRVA